MINNCLNEKLFFGDDVTIASVLTSSKVNIIYFLIFEIIQKM